MTHQFKNCTIDLRGTGYACVSRGDEFEIGHTGEGDRVLIEGDTLDFTGLLILGPVALADRIKAAVALECYALATERDALRAEIARLTADLAESRAYALAQFFAGKMSKKPERIWSRPDYNECWHKRLEEEDVEYVRADLYAAKSAEIARLTAERDYDRKQSEHKSSVIDKLNAALASATIQPDPEARQAALAKAWTMATAAMAERAKSELSAAWAADLIVQWAQSLTPPADLAAKIGGE